MWNANSKSQVAVRYSTHNWSKSSEPSRIDPPVAAILAGHRVVSPDHIYIIGPDPTCSVVGIVNALRTGGSCTTGMTVP